jgi:uncharacterized protein YfbU (UPF0304 family)
MSKFSQEIVEEMSLDDCRYVYDVLDMHTSLRQSFEHLADKEGLALEDVTFHGFDGNNETAHYVFIRFLRDEGQRWTKILKDCELNTHSQTTGRYVEMLSKWRAAGDYQHRHELTVAQIKAIINK